MPAKAPSAAMARASIFVPLVMALVLFPVFYDLMADYRANRILAPAPARALFRGGTMRGQAVNGAGHLAPSLAGREPHRGLALSERRVNG